MTRRVLRLTSRLTLLTVSWVAVSLLCAMVLFLGSSRAINVASHDAEIRPTFTGRVVVHTGPVLPDLRVGTGSRFGVDVRLDKTDAASTNALVQRYGLIASQPEAVRERLSSAVVDMAIDALVRGAALGLVPVLLWVLVGRRRRRELLVGVATPQGAGVVLLVLVVGVGLWAPWAPSDPKVDEGRDWMSLGEFLGPAVPLPAGLDGVEVRGDVTTAQTRRLVESAIDTYDKSKQFYATAAEEAADLVLRVPADDETVVVLVSDRHDNIGMDAVARAVGDAAGATAVYDAGDDTSTGKPWEGFSLDSLDAAFGDEPYAGNRWAVPGNHDHGDFVGSWLADRGWTVLDGEVVDGPGESRLLGVADPRSSGLGNWRDETGLTFGEVAERLADAACAADEDGDRVGTLLVHDANLGEEALARGCTDLVLGGHTHVRSGPEAVVGTNGRTGYSYTTGTTGGAAYAIAIGSKLRRAASISLVTYADGRPAGVQEVVLQTNGAFEVEPYVALALD
ncbi:metallophosphoesterase [Nocardioides sp. SYSU D00038]|uniref:metallophosphoesterase n=1 Tax=Nocardioides sp. SYSU D00038 TaxID=2812554 RepID=UPI0027DCA33F|nr:metallophosphoesterase [Nocardioides sp. SYSU D00038]